MQKTEWDIVTKLKLAGFVVGAGLFLLLVICSEPGFVFIVDHANLLFHEAGHPIIGLFSGMKKRQECRYSLWLRTGKAHALANGLIDRMKRG